MRPGRTEERHTQTGVVSGRRGTVLSCRPRSESGVLRTPETGGRSDRIGPAVAASEEGAWYAVLSRSRHEKMVAARLKEKGVDVFLPLVHKTRRTRGRRVGVSLPLFPCYLFVCCHEHQLIDVGWTPGVIRTLGPGDGTYTPVPGDQIAKIRTALESDLRLDLHPYLDKGQRVRVKYGPLAGLEGILVDRERHHRLVIGVDLISRSASLVISVDDVEPI